MSDDYRELDLRKCIHVKLMTETHAGLKLQSCKLKLSMQAIIDELALLVVEEDPYIMEKLRELGRRRRERAVASMRSTDVDTILNAIEDEQRRRES